MTITKTFKGARVEVTTDIVSVIRVNGAPYRYVRSIPELKQALRSLAWSLAKEQKERKAA